MLMFMCHALRRSCQALRRTASGRAPCLPRVTTGPAKEAYD
jgi:hypothetical protein